MPPSLCHCYKYVGRYPLDSDLMDDLTGSEVALANLNYVDIYTKETLMTGHTVIDTVILTAANPCMVLMVGLTSS